VFSLDGLAVVSPVRETIGDLGDFFDWSRALLTLNEYRCSIGMHGGRRWRTKDRPGTNGLNVKSAMTSSKAGIFVCGRCLGTDTGRPLHLTAPTWTRSFSFDRRAPWNTFENTRVRTVFVFRTRTNDYYYYYYALPFKRNETNTKTISATGPDEKSDTPTTTATTTCTVNGLRSTVYYNNVGDVPDSTLNASAQRDRDGRTTQAKQR